MKLAPWQTFFKCSVLSIFFKSQENYHTGANLSSQRQYLDKTEIYLSQWTQAPTNLYHIPHSPIAAAEELPYVCRLQTDTE